MGVHKFVHHSLIFREVIFIEISVSNDSNMLILTGYTLLFQNLFKSFLIFGLCQEILGIRFGGLVSKWVS